MTGLDLVAWLATALAFGAPPAVAYAVYLGWQALSIARESRARLDRWDEREREAERARGRAAGELESLGRRLEALERRAAPPDAGAPAPPPPPRHAVPPPALPSLERALPEVPAAEGDSDHRGVPTRAGLGPPLPGGYRGAACPPGGRST
ncbi:MAG TPA: hypothetical protein VFS43_22935 [Polyangiaceae bacterium]|nr:hypothetical protein [Polyangiaceae bacterium]